MVMICLFFCLLNFCLLVGYIHYDQKDKRARNDANKTIINYLNDINDGED